MTNRLKISCAACSEHLVVDAGDAGKQVRCPHCQAISIIPKPKNVAPTVAQSHPASNTRIVGCPKCKTRMSVPVRPSAFIAKCPSCQTKVQIPAINTSPQPAVTPASSAPAPPTVARASAPSRSPKPASASSGPGLDFGQLNLPPVQPHGGGVSPTSMSTTAYSPLGGSVKMSSAKSSSPFVDWINHHRWVTAVVLLNLGGWLVCIIFPPLIVVMLVNLPVAATIIGLLFLPRLYLLKSMFGAASGQTMSMGAGGALFVVAIAVKAISRATRRAQNNPDLDFSGFGEAIPVIIGVIIIVVLGAVLWRYIGLARTAAAGYCTGLSILLALAAIGGALNGNRSIAAWKSSDLSNETRSTPLPGFDPEAFLERRRAHDEAMLADIKADQARRQAEQQARFEEIRTRSFTPPPAYQPPPPFVPRNDFGDGPSDRHRIVKRYPITLPIPSSARRVEADTPLEPGVKLSACYAGSWCNLTIVQVNDDGTLRMNWDDYKAFTYDMSREDMIVDNDTLARLGG